MSVTGSQVDLLAKLLDVAGTRHRVIAQNVANANTPNYRQLDVSFEDAFARQLGHGADAAALAVAPKVVEAVGGRERMDGNNVDIDAEMGRLNKNALLYNAYVQILANQLGMMRSAISGH
jgi:flagellar basal-body rod protein FlgB